MLQMYTTSQNRLINRTYKLTADRFNTRSMSSGIQQSLTRPQHTLSGVQFTEFSQLLEWSSKVFRTTNARWRLHFHSYASACQLLHY